MKNIFITSALRTAVGSLNKTLRNKLNDLSIQKKIPLLLSPPSLCTDNAAMIAFLAYLYSKDKSFTNIDFKIFPNMKINHNEY